MTVRRLAFIPLLAGFAIAGELQSQVPAAVQFPRAPAVTGMGSAGVARVGGSGASALNPALVATTPRPAIHLTFEDTPDADVRGLAGRAVFAVPLGLSLGIELHTRRVDDLVEDPAIDESGFRVGDRALRTSVGYAMVGGRLAVGAGMTTTWSDVFGTKGRATFFDLGAVYQIAGPRLAVGAAIRRLGGDLEWTSTSGEPLGVSIPAGIRVGLASGGYRLGPVSASIAADLEHGAELDHAAGAVGVEFGYRDVLLLRAGREMPAAAEGHWTAGIGIRVGELTLDLAYEAVRHVGVRMQIGAGWNNAGSAIGADVR